MSGISIICIAIGAIICRFFGKEVKTELPSSSNCIATTRRRYRPGAFALISIVLIATLVGCNSAKKAVIPTTQDYHMLEYGQTVRRRSTGRREVLDWYQAIGQIRIRSSDPIPASITVEPVLGYKQADKTTQTELTSKQREIQDFLRRYFSEKKAADLRPQNEEKIRVEIRNLINDDILTSSKIRDVKFLTFEIIEQ
jgi:flagellar FliL protein